MVLWVVTELEMGELLLCDELDAVTLALLEIVLEPP